MFVDGPRSTSQVQEILGELKTEIHTADDTRKKALREELDSLAEDMIGRSTPADEHLKAQIQALLRAL